jgi:hypothetical protein
LAHNPQERIVAHAHTEFAGQPSAGLSTECSSHDPTLAREPEGALGAKWEQVGQGFSKRAASAGLIIAEKAPQVE